MTGDLLPAALLDPAAYPHAPDTVELRETHISWVFLAGERAYKVKRPVVFPFLDYGTLERRRAACEAEIEPNRRFAPSVYTGVVALIARGPNSLGVARGSHPLAVEYAVEMRRYDEQATLASRLAAGSARTTDLVAAGGAIAGFHAAAQPADGGRALADVVAETFATLAVAGAPSARLNPLKRFCDAAIVALGPELERREAAGYVRDGHGDLRAEHVLMRTRIEAVDGLEFDRALRITDVAYDLAFLVMDVARRDDTLARALVRGYRVRGGDPGSERLVAFMCCVRALVRAKIDLLRAGQLQGVASAERVRRALALLALAERFAWRVRLPRVVCVAGLAASGKSTLAEALATAAGRPLLSSDRTRKLRAGVDPLAYAGAAAYGDGESRAVYGELGQRAATAARRDGGVIVDATFRRAADADAFAETSPAAADASWIVCEAPPEVMLERAQARAARDDSVSDAGPAIVAAELTRYGHVIPPHAALATIETTRPPADLLDQLATALDARLHESVPCASGAA